MAVSNKPKSDRGSDNTKPIVFIVSARTSISSPLCSRLHSRGVNTVCISDGRLAISQYDGSTRPALVILDTNLRESGGMSAREVAIALHRPTRGVEVVFVTCVVDQFGEHWWFGDVDSFSVRSRTINEVVDDIVTTLVMVKDASTAQANGSEPANPAIQSLN